MIFVPLYLQAGAWQAGFGDQGWFTLAAQIHRPGFTGWRAAIWIHSLAALPWVVGIVGIGFRLVEPELEEQALLDGSASQVFFRVSLRGALPAVGMAAIWTAVVTAGEMTVTDLFSIRTYAEEVYTQAAATASELDAASPSVMLGIAITVVLIIGGWGFVLAFRPAAGRWVCGEIGSLDWDGGNISIFWGRDYSFCFWRACLWEAWHTRRESW